LNPKLCTFLVRVQSQQGVGKLNDFRRDKSCLLMPDAERTRSTDVGVAAEAKQVLGDVVRWLKDPGRWEEDGVRPPRGILLEGAPGNGKPLLARAVAGEAGVRFFVTSATDFVELFVGAGAARVRDLLETAARNSARVIFVDEFDAVGRRRIEGIDLASVLIDSMSQVAEPAGPARAEFDVLDGSTIVGGIIWANPELIELQVDGEPLARVVPRAQIRSARVVHHALPVAAPAEPAPPYPSESPA